MPSRVPKEEKKVGLSITMDKELSRMFDNYRTNFLELGGDRAVARTIRFTIYLELCYGLKYEKRLSSKEKKELKMFLKDYMEKQKNRDPLIFYALEKRLKKGDLKKW